MFIVAIDGPAGTGKGTITKIVAEKLGLVTIDTGATYRCITLAMIKKNVKITSNEGLHARPATEISKIANKYNCDVNIKANNKIINAKMPLMIMSLGITQNTNVEILCNGENEEKAMEEITRIIE